MTNPPLLPRDQQRALQAAARAKLAIDHLEDFVRQAWVIIEPETPLVWNWHLSLICRVLEQLTRGELKHDDGSLVREVVICVPPGMTKSRLVSVLWPAWQWLQRPTERLLCIANDDDLVKEHSRFSRDVIVSPWYRNLVELIAKDAAGVPWQIKADQNELINFGTTRQGFRQCKPIRGNITGKRGHGHVLDDPYDAKQAIIGSVAQVLRRMTEVIDIYRGVLSTRVLDRRTAYRVTIMQRLHEADLAGYLIAKGAYAVVLAMEFDPDHPNNHPDDPRTEPGELLFPARFPRDVVEEMKVELGARHYAAQCQQRPSPAGGTIYQRTWLDKRYTTDPQRMLMDEWGISLDCAFKRTDTTDFIAMHVWGRRGLAEFFLLHRIHARMTYTETRRAFVDLIELWPQARLRLVEDKANGPALIDDLKLVVPGLVPFSPKLSKEARAQVAARFFEAGNVWLPDASIAPWIGEYVEELAGFGAGAPNDDDVDATSQILMYWSGAQGDGDPLEKARKQYSFLDAL